ncbi:Uncharacterised protein [Vibrio cholerae]|nr:Uncharacterised protein [Vibrio cholerae]
MREVFRYLAGFWLFVRSEHQSPDDWPPLSCSWSPYNWNSRQSVDSGSGKDSR